MFVATASYRHRVIEVTDLITKSYRVVVIEVAESKKKKTLSNYRYVTLNEDMEWPPLSTSNAPRSDMQFCWQACLRKKAAEIKFFLGAINQYIQCAYRRKKQQLEVRKSECNFLYTMSAGKKCRKYLNESYEEQK